jgi:beta-galactosidase
MAQEIAAFSAVFNDNIDSAIINVGHEDLGRYKLVVVPGDYLMDRASADALRDYVVSGGAVVMTAYSAKVDEHAQWFQTPLPGRLSDVFGIKTNEFYFSDDPLTVNLEHGSVTGSERYYEVLEPSTAKVLATFGNVPGTPPAVTMNRFGKGLAIYVATPAQAALMQPLLRNLYPQLGIAAGPATPPGVYARVVDGRTLYVNTTTEAKTIAIPARATGLITGTTWDGTLRLGPYGVDLVQPGRKP